MAGRPASLAKLCRPVFRQGATLAARSSLGGASAAAEILASPYCSQSSSNDLGTQFGSRDVVGDPRWGKGRYGGACFSENGTENFAARCILGLEDRCFSTLTVGRAGSRWVVSNRRQTALYSTPALEVEDETFHQASKIGYEVVGQYRHEVDGISPQAVFAVVQVGAHQFKVSPGDMIYTEKLKYADINEKLLLSKVLLVGSLEETIIGRPLLPTARVTAVVEEIALDEKVIVFKKKRRKNYRRTNGHRQELTRIRILKIETAAQKAGGCDTHPEIMEATG